MRIYGNPLAGDPRVCSGESGAVTLGLLSLLMQAPSLATARAALGLDAQSRVLLVSTEGDTDPQCYLDIVWDGEIPSCGLIK
jgi:diaminopropionate ammonia-lyase